jgi:hypothetical protein
VKRYPQAVRSTRRDERTFDAEVRFARSLAGGCLDQAEDVTLAEPSGERNCEQHVAGGGIELWNPASVITYAPTAAPAPTTGRVSVIVAEAPAVHYPAAIELGEGDLARTLAGAIAEVGECWA